MTGTHSVRLRILVTVSLPGTVDRVFLVDPAELGRFHFDLLHVDLSRTNQCVVLVGNLFFDGDRLFDQYRFNAFFFAIARLGDGLHHRARDLNGGGADAGSLALIAVIASGGETGEEQSGRQRGDDALSSGH